MVGVGPSSWVIEGTGCFQGCGIDPYSGYQVAVSHVLALITRCSYRKTGYAVPFFFFSGTDFYIGSSYWPIGIMDLKGHPKPLRQDLGMRSHAHHVLRRRYKGCNRTRNNC